MHLLRDIHKLHEDHPKDSLLSNFFAEVKRIYKNAKDLSPPANPLARRDNRRAYEKELYDLAKKHLGDDRPEQAIAKRIVRRITGLFSFVEHPTVPSDNNPAERSIRPLVILRKMSGGTRSAAGSRTVAILMSLFGTWKLQGLDLIEQCQQMICAKPSLTPA